MVSRLVGECGGGGGEARRAGAGGVWGGVCVCVGGGGTCRSVTHGDRRGREDQLQRVGGD